MRSAIRCSQDCRQIQDGAIGHFRRSIPEEYLASIRSGRNHFSDLAMGRLYEQLKVITSGRIWSRPRWRLIAKLNLGL